VTATTANKKLIELIAGVRNNWKFTLITLKYEVFTNQWQRQWLL
jgi:hypothetical protein